MANYKPTIFSFFSGVGFLDLGFELSGYPIKYVNEINSSFMHAYRYSREQLKLQEVEYGYFNGDIAELTEGENKTRVQELVSESIRNSGIVGFIGGPPCPDFSIGGKNRGHRGDHGRLSSTYVEIICQQQPSFFMFENVKGLWKTKKHRTFYEEIKLKLNNAGYVLTEKLINALEYGVPQDRERIILVGFQKDLLRSLGVNVVSKGMLENGAFPWQKYALYRLNDIQSYSWPGRSSFIENSSSECPENIAVELTVEHWFRLNEVEKHPNSMRYFKPRAGLARFATIDEGDVSKKSFKRLHRWRYSPTACYGNNEVHLHPYKKRRISVPEALAIQSLPKNFTLPPDLSLSNAFKMIGNGVPYLASRAIAMSILDFLEVKA